MDEIEGSISNHLGEEFEDIIDLYGGLHVLTTYGIQLVPLRDLHAAQRFKFRFGFVVLKS